MENLLVFLIKLLFIPAFAPLCVGIIRKLKALMQNRQGASIFQPYRNLIKLFQKDEVISENASWIFTFTPYLLFILSIVIPLGIPFLGSNYNILGLSDLLVVIYLLVLSSFFLSLAGIDTGSSFGGFGSSREMTILALTEGGLLFSFIPLALLSQTTSLPGIVQSVSSLDLINFGPVIIAFTAFMIALLAENSRIPFDNPATHLELTMVHEAMILEYSGKRLALIEWAAANKLLLFIVLGVTLFFPSTPIFNLQNLASVITTFGMLLIKIILVAGGIAVLESSIAKLRFFRLPDLLLTAFVLGLIATFVVVI